MATVTKLAANGLRRWIRLSSYSILYSRCQSVHASSAAPGTIPFIDRSPLDIHNLNKDGKEMGVVSRSPTSLKDEELAKFAAVSATW